MLKLLEVLLRESDARYYYHGYLNAFGAGKGTRVTKEKATKGRRAKETKERQRRAMEKAKENELTKPNKGNEKDKPRKGFSARAKSIFLRSQRHSDHLPTRRTSLERVPRHVPRASPEANATLRGHYAVREDRRQEFWSPDLTRQKRQKCQILRFRRPTALGDAF